MHALHSLIDQLEASPHSLFNPWYEMDAENDRSEQAPAIRREQLHTYLRQRVGRAKVLLIAEALGYQGGHFTGIAMTSERILLGHQQEKYGVTPEMVFTDVEPQRTSKKSVNEKGMSEPTATIVWGALARMKIDPYSVVLWNALPWHPWNPKKGLLSNRTPTNDELEAGHGLLRQFLELFPDATIVAVGRKCEQSLTELKIEHSAVRHPANGGAPAFRKQLRALYRQPKTD
ncbi:MAG: uracil-DNA glycosylase [Balneolaceae bacterium]